jgi:hypothetical protein
MKTYSINFLAGQILAQQRLIGVLARLVSDRDEFGAEGQLALLKLSEEMKVEQVPPQTLDGIAAVDTWLSSVTGQT